ncbi:MAG: sigma-70 family RNA polymerase sigma factor [Planctomycetales bacterium]|nr:sigma-70 family RNA polymerase sigma factor [Planctomycetales bacterium]
MQHLSADDPMERDNGVWIKELHARAEPALADLRLALLRNLRRALARQVRVDDAFLEDAVQESLLKILAKLDQFAGRSQFLTWATSLAIHTALGGLRRARWKDVSLDDLAEGAPFSPAATTTSDESPEMSLERRALLTLLRNAIEEDLTVRQRTALTAELRGMPQDQIALQMKSNRNAIYKLTHDARKKLKVRLEAAGYTAADVSALCTR